MAVAVLSPMFSRLRTALSRSALIARPVAATPRVATLPLLAWPRAVRASTPLLPPCINATRSIIMVDVHQPADRSSPGDPGSRIAMFNEVARAEEIAMAQFNRLIYEEVERGCLRPGARRNKRWARHTRRGLRMRDNRKATKWRAHKRKVLRLMNWVRRRSTALPLRALFFFRAVPADR